MKIQVVIDIPEISEVSSDELDCIRENIGVALSDGVSYPSARVCSLEVSYE